MSDYEPEHVSKHINDVITDNDAVYTAEHMDEINNTLDNRISNLDNEHSSLETDVDTLKDLVAAMETRMETVEGSILDGFKPTPVLKHAHIGNLDPEDAKRIAEALKSLGIRWAMYEDDEGGGDKYARQGITISVVI